VLADIAHDLRDALRRQQRPLGVDGRHLLVLDARRGLDRVDVVDAEGQHVLVVDGIDDGVGVQLVTEGLLGGAPQRGLPPVPEFSAKIGVPVKPNRW
jgi:hypothetical protein